MLDEGIFKFDEKYKQYILHEIHLVVTNATKLNKVWGIFFTQSNFFV